jgi:5-formyltetrahydrofolate cyclo-ligase
MGQVMWQGAGMSDEKQELRKTLRTARRDHVAALDERTRALLFLRPPRPLLEAVTPRASIGLYNAMPHEAPTSGYARYFAEQGHLLALPRFAHRGALMEFARFSDVFDETDLETGPIQAVATFRRGASSGARCAVCPLARLYDQRPQDWPGRWAL